MNKKKCLALLLSIAMVLAIAPLPALAANGIPTVISAQTDAKTVLFNDITSHWAEKAITRWSGYGVINGYDGSFKPKDNLTRAEMATIITNLLGLSSKAANGYADLKGTEWYANAILKCTAAGIIKGDGKNCRAGDFISRQEASVMLSRALGIKPVATPDLSAFTDAAKVADWASGYVSTMAKAGIVNGVGGGKFAPTSNIDRASTATILDKAISDYVNKAGTYDKLVGTGIVVVTVPDIILKGNKIAGSLLVSEGVGDGSLTLDGTNVAGNTTVRGGGVNSIVVKGGSKLGDVTISRVDGAVRVVTSGGSTIEATFVDDGKDDVILEGKLGNVSVAGEVPVTLKSADVKTVTATGKNADITVDKNSKVVTVATAQENTKITVAGTVTNVAATAEAKGVALNVAKGGTATSVTTAATGSVIKNDGNLGALAIAKGADTVFAKGENATKTNITATDKKDLGVTTIDAQNAKEAAAKAAADKLAAEQAAAKAAADKVAADKLAAAAKSEADKAAAAKAQAEAAAKAAAAKAAADKAAADKAAADKAAADSKKEEDKVKEETKVEEKPVTPPVVDTDKPGEIVIPKPVEPDKPKPQPDPDPVPPPYIPESEIDTIITGGITDVNTAIKGNGAYAVLSALGTDNSVTVNMSNVATKVSKVYTDIVQVLVDALKANTNTVSKITANTKELVLTNTITAQDIKDFVKASGLHGTDSTEITGADTIGELHGQTLTAVVTDVYGGKVTYTVKFVGSIPESQIDTIITGGITDVNTAISNNGAYAVLSALGTDNSVTVNMSNVATSVSKVYTDIVQVLVDALVANTATVTKITANTKDLVLTQTISAQDIKDFVKASGLHGTDSAEITGADTIGELHNQTLTAVVTDVYGGKVTYTVKFVGSIPESQIDTIITGGITDVNAAIVSNGTYAVLGALQADNSVTVDIDKGATKVSAVYTDIVQVLVDALVANTATVTKITANTKDLVLTDKISAQDIKDFVKASGLHGTDSTEITGGDSIDELVGQTLTAVVTDVYGGTVTYTVKFVNTKNAAQIDEIISGGITNVNKAIKGNKTYINYAVLGALKDDNSVKVTISAAQTPVSAVYTDIVEVLVDALKANTDTVSKITANTKDLVLTKTITAQDIEAFVKASGLHGLNSTEITGADTIGELHGQTLTAVVTSANGAQYTYTVTFELEIA